MCVILTTITSSLCHIAKNNLETFKTSSSVKLARTHEDNPGSKQGPVRLHMHVACLIFKASNVMSVSSHCYVPFEVLFLLSSYFMQLSQFGQSLCIISPFHLLNIMIHFI